jgi:RNA polymerase sigma factor (sigma-70 family)
VAPAEPYGATSADDSAEPYDVTALVRASRDGDEAAWKELVQRYAALISTVIRRYRLAGPDAQDISQLVWLRLVEHLNRIREPAALPGWLVTTTRHECQRYVRTNQRTVSMDPALMAAEHSDTDGDLDQALLAAERLQVLRDALDELPSSERRLLKLLASERAPSYAEISEILGMAKGSIGPSRQRAVGKLRQTRAVQAYLRADEAE